MPVNLSLANSQTKAKAIQFWKDNNIAPKELLKVVKSRIPLQYYCWCMIKLYVFPKALLGFIQDFRYCETLERDAMVRKDGPMCAIPPLLKISAWFDQNQSTLSDWLLLPLRPLQKAINDKDQEQKTLWQITNALMGFHQSKNISETIYKNGNTAKHLGFHQKLKNNTNIHPRETFTFVAARSFGR